MSTEPQAGPEAGTEAVNEEEEEEEQEQEHEEGADDEEEAEDEEDEVEEEQDWQDDQCSTVTPQERTGTKLCNACVKIFLPNRRGYFHHDPVDGPSCPHIKFFDTLQRSASRGCELCNYVLRSLRACEIEHVPAQELRLQYFVFECYGVSPISQASSQQRVQNDLDYLKITFGYRGGTNAVSLTAYNTIDAILLGKDKMYLPNQARSSRALPNIDLFKTWMSECLTKHTICSRFHDETYTPSRLLKMIIDADDVCRSVRLIETSDQVSNLSYMALSHCWGDCDFLNLTTENRSRLLSGFDITELPKTFSDAICLTHRLGAEYLWIDSLCIIQDSESDWEREAYSMKKVYSNATCTIAATGAQNSRQGLYRSEGDAKDICHIAVETSWSFGSNRVLFLVEDIRDTDISYSPLLKRAWVVQEMALSPRKLHFAKSQIHWECQEHVACESFPHQYPWTMLVNRNLYRWPEYRGLQDSRSCSISWWALVEAYSSGILTKSSDKFAAFAGVAEQFRILNGGLTYICGMWGENMPSDLLWYIRTDHANLVSSRRTQRYRAPSWSWLSLDNASVQNTQVREFHQRCLVEALDVAVDVSGHDAYGPIIAAALHIKGLLKSVSVVKLQEKGVHLLRTDHHSVPIYLDDDNEDTAGPIFCLPFYEQGTSTVVGLLLEPAVDGGALDRLRRTAYFVCEKDVSLFTHQHEDGIWKPLQPTTITLV